jgi:hypothetical protein
MAQMNDYPVREFVTMLPDGGVNSGFGFCTCFGEIYTCCCSCVLWLSVAEIDREN